jgi:hypothetical protein
MGPEATTAPAARMSATVSQVPAWALAVDDHWTPPIA